MSVHLNSLLLPKAEEGPLDFSSEGCGLVCPPNPVLQDALYSLLLQCVASNPMP